MNLYLKALAAIILLYISIMNLSFFKIETRKIILMIILSDVISSILLHFGFGEFLILIPMMIIPILFLYKNSKNIVNSVSIPILSLLIYVVSTYILTNICFNLFHIDIYVSNDNIVIYWSLFSVEFIFAFIISKLLGIVMTKKINISNLEFKGKFALLIILSLILTVVIFYSNIILGGNNTSKSELLKINGILFSSYFILLMIIIYILIRSITKELEFRSKQHQFENLEQYTNNLEKLYSDMRSFRHDYINILSSMVGYIQSDDMKGLRKHFNEKILPLSNGMEDNNFKIGILKNIKIPEIKGIFSSKLIRAQEMGIDVYIEITEPIDKFNMDIIDLSRSIGILIDNAIEASVTCDNPTIKLAIIHDEKGEKIIIINSCTEDTPPVYKIYQKGFSTKGTNRGIGLYNLKEVISKYAHTSLDTIIENGEFKQLLQINKA